MRPRCKGGSAFDLASCGISVLEAIRTARLTRQWFDNRRTNWYDGRRTIDRRSIMPDSPAPAPKRPPFRRVVVFVPLEQPSA
jgi:hypothetical protein